MKEEYPRVVAAAIVGHDGIVVSMPPPARHHTLISHMAYDLNHPIPIKGTQGFLLSDGSFADRITAKKMAVKNEQLLPRASKLDELFSEDVW